MIACGGLRQRAVPAYEETACAELEYELVLQNVVRERQSAERRPRAQQAHGTLLELDEMPGLGGMLLELDEMPELGGMLLELDEMPELGGMLLELDEMPGLPHAERELLHAERELLHVEHRHHRREDQLLLLAEKTNTDTDSARDILLRERGCARQIHKMLLQNRAVVVYRCQSLISSMSLADCFLFQQISLIDRM